MIVITKDGYVIGEGQEITIVNTQGEENLIKVNVNPDEEYGFWYIGTEDRDTYQILDLSTPDPEKQWKFIDNEFIEN
jgi:hypothetical protein